MNKKFLVSELFEVKTTKSIDKNKIIFASNGEYDFIGRSGVNNGIQGKVNRLDYEPNPRNTFSLVQVGESVCLFREHEWYASQNIFILIPKIEELCLVPMYIIATINAYLSVLFGSAYTYPKLTDVKGIPMQLPVIEHTDPNHEYTVDDIDWQYMEDRIKELEEDRIKELDAYLKATNLDDYELTDEDKKVLSLSRKSTSNENGSLETDCENGQVRFKKVRIGSLFDVHPTKSYKLKNRELFATGGNTPVLSNSSTNNGIGGYCALEPTEEGKIITFSDTTTGADTMFYQKEPFIGYPHVQGMYPYNSFVWNEKRYLYLISAIRKSAGDGWSYAVKFNRALVCELMVELPVTVDGEPDFDYMERYIRAIEKLAIANVVKYKDKVIDTTKMLINSKS